MDAENMNDNIRAAENAARLARSELEDWIDDPNESLPTEGAQRWRTAINALRDLENWAARAASSPKNSTNT